MYLMDYLSIGSVPSAEPCIQLGEPDYHRISRLECSTFAKQLQRTFGEPPSGSYFRIKGFDHDFGRYYEVCVVYDLSDPVAEAFAYRVENEMPEEWDAAARMELDAAGYFSIVKKEAA